jgi:dimethylhistidine N-methyltransferase
MIALPVEFARLAQAAASRENSEFRTDAMRGLAKPRKTLPCKYLYDETGSRLFEEICRLPEYYLTRAELNILRRYAAEMADWLGRNCLLIEYGSGASVKTRWLLDHLASPAAYVPIDIACEQLAASSAALAEDYRELTVRPVCGDFTRRLVLPTDDLPVRRRIVYFPGSTIGNFSHAEAVRLLKRTARLCGPGGGLLLGADLKKSPRVLKAAYNDRRGVTAAFNKNVLVRMNRELDADFRLDDFGHQALYNPRRSRIEMHLVSGRDQSAVLSGRAVRFSKGESIRTECCHKYSLEDLARLGTAAGFQLAKLWTDERRYFSVSYFALRS